MRQNIGEKELEQREIELPADAAQIVSRAIMLAELTPGWEYETERLRDIKAAIEAKGATA